MSILGNYQKAIQQRKARYRSKISQRWFKQRLKEFGAPRPQDLIRDKLLIKESNGRPGYMYYFGYDPKHKETLPFYDRYPLIVLLDITKTGFSGLNLHYLEPKLRAAFLDKLTDTANNKNLTENTRMQLTYDMLKSASKFKAFKPCYKNYLFDHVRTVMKRVPSNHWETVSFLPVEKFVKQSKTAVWKDSRSKI